MRLNAFAVALLLATNSLVWASEDILNRADALIRLQSPEQAYELLAPLEDELAGILSLIIYLVCHYSNKINLKMLFLLLSVA